MREILLAADTGYDAAQARDDEAAAFKDVDPGEYNMYRAEIEYLSQCILDDRAPEMNTLEDGLQILRLAEATYRSAKEGVRVDL